VNERVPILFAHFGNDWIRGSERCLLDLLTHIDRRRFHPIVWCNAPTLAEQVRQLDVSVQLSRFTILFHWTPPRFDIANYGRLVRTGRRLVRTHGIRLIHANSGAPNQWLLPVARSMRLPLLTYLMIVYNLRDRCTLGLHQVSLAVGMSRGCIDGLIADGMPASRTRVIHGAVDVALIGRGDHRDLRHRLGIPPDAVTLTRIGSLIHRKGVDTLLQAVAHLRAEHANCHLLIVGDGPDRTKLEALARQLGLEAVTHFLGHVEPAGSVLRDATDIAISPARDEGFGLTVIEAGAFGLPVVATDTPGMREILIDRETGLIVPIEDIPGLAHAIRTLIDDPALRRRLGVAARESVERRFLVSRYVADFEEAYDELLHEPGSRLGWTGAWSSPAICGRWIGKALRRRLDQLAAPPSRPQ
jgi:glycosyltransferase involved in cell wall biosynthesis